MNNVKYVHTEEVHNTHSASAFMPVLHEFITPHSVLDIGCGTGTWLKVLKEHGSQTVLGIDGPNVDPELLVIAKEEFRVHDLREKLDVGRRYELAICLEVVEHLPPATGEMVIDLLTRHADTILFSAALPLQGGQNHINEQSFKYWVEKFNKRGFIVDDCFRRKIWENENIDWWYKQNMFLAVKQDQQQQPQIHDYYHPELYRKRVTDLNKFQQACEWLMVTEQKYTELVSGKIAVKEACRILWRSVLNSIK